MARIEVTMVVEIKKIFGHISNRVGIEVILVS